MDAVERLNRRLLLVALALGVLAALIAHAYLQGVARRVLVPHTVPVVVAAESIPPHTLVTSAMVAVREFEPADRPPDAVTAVGGAVGAITTAEVYQGQPLVASDLSTTQTPLNLAYAVPAGMRAFTMAVSDTSGVADMIHPGDHVDVLAIFTQGGTAPTTTVDTLEESLTVLAVGQRLVGETTPVPPSYSTVTLAVTPAQAAVLAYASTRGGLTLDLRNVTDQATIQLAPETGVGIPGAG